MIHNDIEEMFKRLNKEVTEDITFNEVKTYAQETGNDRIDALLNYSLKYCNNDESGIFDFNEVLNRMRLANNVDDFKYLFKIFDHNSDCSFNSSELRNVINFVMFSNISRKDASRIIKEVIGHKKYKISYEEYLEIMRKLKNV